MRLAGAAAPRHRALFMLVLTACSFRARLGRMHAQSDARGHALPACLDPFLTIPSEPASSERAREYSNDAVTTTTADRSAVTAVQTSTRGCAWPQRPWGALGPVLTQPGSPPAPAPGGNEAAGLRCRSASGTYLTKMQMQGPFTYLLTS